jgi:ubiquinone/menaquinone biosynthesis C-methylase UbiE
MIFWFRTRRLQRTATEPSTTSTFPPLEQRTRLEDTPYLLPKDEQEDKRLYYQHHVLYKTLSNHYLAPISPATDTILDVGTGTGIWPVDMAGLFPKAHILGVDVSLASLPDPLPTTCLFVQANILKGLPFPDKQFTFTHQRFLVAGIPANDWPAAVSELVRVTRPGGWIELLEIGDIILNAGPATNKLLKWMTDISRGFGFEMNVLQQLGNFLEQAGCDAVESQDIPVPLGEWAGNVGQMLKTDVIHGWSALKDIYCPRSQTSPAAFDAMLADAQAEWERLHASYVFHAAYGRRRRERP